MTEPEHSPMLALAGHLAAVSDLLKTPEVSVQLGDGLLLELGYPIASFRARFPHLMPGAQQILPIPGVR
ncbi:hypothetical protein LAV84_27895 [Rhizobium sp. VS19-DR104.2]|uniref:hypothetical protein n=1 Tax=Rhizobium/Agrobacterium group TaxID=227290 RepID=UPI001CC3CBDC|nr:MULTISPECIES: hypothetical protein [unclassified Rhizobium]MBZ5763328.1 hypothetical protein [Rhizobium sp. VS19-DR96]MBZ5769223.1 hypothetical protein [Rhizobium sp. VS19-DR129.2]MBZ5776782.1 hypothetical protein [Rhizobium sp. VS19-DRK62.2]MBZ5788198.1 hypothetical protein [Rhizobium sp. VS19-DR121]MBZ5805281.1 hypothetical protein [Rhizobium sp. VS19-DR181]